MKKNYFLPKFQLLGLLLMLSFPALAQTYENGVFVLNEGGTVSVSFLGSDDTVQNNIFATANPNQGALGSIGQSLSFNGDYAYLVMNGSNTVKIVNRYTFQYIATVSTGLSNPRYMAFANGKGYITNWGSGGSASDDYVAVLDLQTNSITSTIPAAEGVERIELYNGKLYVAHQGGYGYGKTISVIDPENDTIEAQIIVGDVPNSMVFRDNYLYVLCGGVPFWGTPVPESDGSLVRIDLTDNSATLLAEFDGLHTSNLEIDDTNSFYFSADEVVYKASLSAPSLFSQLFSLSAQGVYGIYGMDMIDGKLYVADAGDYTSPGKAYVYSTAGAPLNVFTVGVIPNAFHKAEPNLSIPSSEGLSFKIYPNPTSGRFFVDTNTSVAISVYDQTGRRILSQKYTTAGIDVTKLPTGIYIVEATGNDRVGRMKLIVK